MTRVGMSQSLMAVEATDFGFVYNIKNHRLAGRLATGRGYEDADGKNFVDRYGYKENYAYNLIEGSITGKHKDFIYRGEATYTKDIMFPYLLMDERENLVVSGSVEYNNHKLYLNYTDHMMDNGLRVSMGSMVTDVTNLTVGFNGPFYELYYRNWNASNEISTPMTTIYNPLFIPDVELFSGTVRQEIETDYFSLWSQFGFVYQKIDGEEHTDIYRLLYEKAEDSRSYALLDFGVNHYYDIFGNFTGSISADYSMQAPQVENLYISVKKPAGKAWWVGNPTLKSPTRTTLRANVHHKDIVLEIYGTYVWDYVNMSRRSDSERNYQTYENIDATFLGLNLTGIWKYLDINAGYIWAKNKTSNRPLSEIVPFSVLANLKSPIYKGFSGNLRFSYNDAQTRVDKSLNELPSSSWYQIDFGVNYKIKYLNFSLTVQNLADELYYQHMSYLRNPFSSGMRIYEPGRIIMLNILYSSDIGN
jgi:iron complex outermembrane receptor protein